MLGFIVLVLQENASPVVNRMACCGTQPRSVDVYDRRAECRRGLSISASHLPRGFHAWQTRRRGELQCVSSGGIKRHVVNVCEYPYRIVASFCVTYSRLPKFFRLFAIYGWVVFCPPDSDSVCFVQNAVGSAACDEWP